MPAIVADDKNSELLFVEPVTYELTSNSAEKSSAFNSTTVQNYLKQIERNFRLGLLCWSFPSRQRQRRRRRSAARHGTDQSAAFAVPDVVFVEGPERSCESEQTANGRHRTVPVSESSWPPRDGQLAPIQGQPARQRPVPGLATAIRELQRTRDLHLSQSETEEKQELKTQTETEKMLLRWQRKTFICEVYNIL